jgi:hypothetical protein
MAMRSLTSEGSMSVPGSQLRRRSPWWAALLAFALLGIAACVGHNLEVGDGIWEVGEVANPGGAQRYGFVAAAGDSLVVETAVGSIGDTVLELYDTDGTSLLASDDDGGDGFASRILWTAPADGRYFVMVKGYGDAVGRFAIHVDRQWLVIPECPASTTGSVYASGVTVFKAFFALQGQTFAITTVLGSLPDSTLTLYGPDANTQLAFDDDGGPGLASRIDWVAPADGVYYVAINGYGTATGSFQLQVGNDSICTCPSTEDPFGCLWCDKDGKNCQPCALV